MAGMAISASGLRAQSPEERAKKIIADTVHALGGDGFRYMTTREEKGRAYSFYRERINGLSIAHFYTKYLPPDDKGEATRGIRQMQRQIFGKKEDNWIILKAQEGWEITFRGATKLPEDRIQQFRESSIRDLMYILRTRIDEPGIIFEARRREVTENQPVEVIDITDSENRKITAYIHSTTLLPVKQSYKRWDTNINDRREEVTRFTKYREAGNGVMWPYDVQRERDGERTFELYAEKVVIGGELKPELFELPRGAKIIEKKTR